MNVTVNVNETSINGVWLDFYEGRASIQKVMTAYDEQQVICFGKKCMIQYDPSPKGTKVLK